MLPRERRRRNWLDRLSERDRLLILSVVVGMLAGFAAVLLTGLIHLIRHFLTSWFSTDAHYALYLVYPGAGMFLSLLLVRFLIKDDIGHGVTKVLVAVSKNESRIKAHNTWSSLLTSALTIGFGGSVGAEAPIVYTGAAIGSNFARLWGLSYRNMTILLGAGAAAAVAGIFKAPLAGVLFTLEILMFNISMSSIMPVLFATVSATVVTYIFNGQSPFFQCTITAFAMRNLPFYVVLGVVAGLFSLYFLRMTLWMEDRMALRQNPFLKWLCCAVGLGVLIFLFPPLYGEGYESLIPLLNGASSSPEGTTILGTLLQGEWMVPLFFLLVALFKVVSMTLTNAGGGVGGTFGPTLVVGGFVGFTVARTINLVSPDMVPEQNFVLVGMAGLMAGVMQAPMTAIFLIAEITGGYGLFLPLITTSVVSFGVMRIFEQYSIYSKRIAKAGELLTHDSDQSVLTLLKTTDLIEKDFVPVAIDATLGEFVNVISVSNRNIFPVTDSKGRFQGFVSLESVRSDMFRTELYDKKHVYNYVRSAPEYVHEDEDMKSVMRKFETTEAWSLPVVGAERSYVGFVSKSRIFTAYRDELKKLSSE